MPQPENVTLQKEVHSKTLLSSHPLAIALTVTVLLFLAGSTILAQRAGTQSPQEPQVWTNTAFTLTSPTFTPEYTPVQTSPDITTATDTGTVPLYTYSPPVSTTPKGSSDVDFETFLTHMLSSSGTYTTGTSTVNAGTDADIQSVYALIPKGLISTSTTRKMTASQEELYAYGNAVGTIVKDFDAVHPDELKILSAQAADRTNPAKAQALRSLGEDIAAVGVRIRAIKDVPEAARAVHDALSQSYVDIGKKLSGIADASGDKAALEAIKTYNAAADTFTENYIALAVVFSVSGVSFSSTDGGSAFMFSGSGGL
ncbi:hypothetical protein K8R03_04395 [Candidatus Kaiserbacteria bacterium]|nr:hypothetical protein [Candidatus Kaiserbacteria bacterium]